MTEVLTKGKDYDAENGLSVDVDSQPYYVVTKNNDKILQQGSTYVMTGSVNEYYSKSVIMDEASDRAFDRAAHVGLQPGRRMLSIVSMRSPRNHEEKKNVSCDTLVVLLFKTKDFFMSVILNSAIKSIFAMLISCAITAFMVEELDKENYWHQRLRNSRQPVTILGTFVTFALVFRTNVCYDRWWEARLAWGDLSSAVTHITRQGSSWVNDKSLRDRFVAYCVVLPYACKSELRSNRFDDEQEEGKNFVEMALLSQEELDYILNNGNSCGQTCLDMLWSIMNNAITRDDGLAQGASRVRATVMRRMEDSVSQISRLLWSLKKLKNTGMPITYDYFVNFTILVFVFASNFVWAPTLGWLTPLITLLILFVLNAVVFIGDRMLDCFGVHLVGLPMQKYCKTTERQTINCHLNSSLWT